MAKLTGTALEYISAHVVEVRKHKGNKRRVLIVADGKDAAERIAIWLKTAWNAESIKDNNDSVPNDISIQFDTVRHRDNAVSEINKEISDYRKAHPETIVPPAVDTPSSDEVTTGTDEESVATKRNWITYAVIGVAVVAILIILFRKKKK